jgi:hypothetical protein
MKGIAWEIPDILVEMHPGSMKDSTCNTKMERISTT